MEDKWAKWDVERRVREMSEMRGHPFPKPEDIHVSTDTCIVFNVADSTLISLYEQY